MRNVWNRITGHWLLNGIVIITIAIGLMFPIAILSTISYMIDNMHLCEYDDPENRVFVNCHGSYQDPGELHEKLAAGTEGVAHYGYVTYEPMLTFTEERMYIRGVSGVTQSYLELEGYLVTEGRLINEQEYEQAARVCMLDEAENNNTFHLKIGDTISLMGEDYKVVGFVSVPKRPGSIMVPYRCLPELLGENSTQFMFSFQMENETAVRYFSAGWMDFTDYSLEIQYGEEISKPYVQSIRQHITDKFKQSSVVALSALFSILFILYGKTMEEQCFIGLRLALGATGGRIYREMLAENLLLTGTALLLDLLLFPAVIRQVRTVYGYPSGWMLAWIIGGLVLITAAVTGAVYLRVTGKRAAIEMLKGEV